MRSSILKAILPSLGVSARVPIPDMWNSTQMELTHFVLTVGTINWLNKFPGPLAPMQNARLTLQTHLGSARVATGLSTQQDSSPKRALVRRTLRAGTQLFQTISFARAASKLEKSLRLHQEQFTTWAGTPHPKQTKGGAPASESEPTNKKSRMIRTTAVTELKMQARITQLLTLIV